MSAHAYCRVCFASLRSETDDGPFSFRSTDNPPPKVVQGYKFNIFYPDLIDKSKAPTYKIIKEPGNDETVLLHFSAGPPYEDIAFRIVNREWEFSHKR